MLTEKTRIIFDWIVDHDGENFTAADIAEATGFNTKAVNAVITTALAGKRGLVKRVSAEIEVEEDGKTKHKEIKFITLTDEGRKFDPDSEEE